MSEETKGREVDVEMLKLYGPLKEMNQIVVDSYKAMSHAMETVKKVEEFLRKFCDDRSFNKR